MALAHAVTSKTEAAYRRSLFLTSGASSWTRGQLIAPSSQGPLTYFMMKGAYRRLRTRVVVNWSIPGQLIEQWRSISARGI